MTTEPIGKAENPGRESLDWSLLLDRLERDVMKGAGPDELRPLVEKIASSRIHDTSRALRSARLAMAAGFADKGLELLAAVNREYPDCREAWQERFEALLLLGQRGDALQVRALCPDPAWLKAHELAPSASALEDEGDIDSIIQPPEEKQEKGQSRQENVFEPFHDLHRRDGRKKRYMDLFRGREDAFARQWSDREKGEQGYSPVNRPFQEHDLEEHLSGRATFGLYLMRHDSTVRTAVIDIDLVKKYRDTRVSADVRLQIKREAVYIIRRLRELGEMAGLPCLAEFSGGKGYHLWYFFAEPLPAMVVRKALCHLVSQVKHGVSCFHVEVFPKQDSLSGKGYGNLVKLPLGIHRGTGKSSFFLESATRDVDVQLDFLKTVRSAEGDDVRKLAALRDSAKVVAHPRYESWAREFPELAALESQCDMIAQIMATARSARELSMREEKILFGTVAHLPEGRKALHHLFENLPEYNRPLLDYKISLVRGTPLGCKRIHSLLGDSGAALPCRITGKKASYPHPLLHLEGYDSRDPIPVSERLENLRDALENLKIAIGQTERFLMPKGK